jgi:hypothetical protein
MGPTADNEFTENLGLALIYLSSWKEQEFGVEVRRAWKGYDFSLLDRLNEEGLINFSYKAKSLYLTEEGVRRAEEVVKRLKVGML